MSVWIAAVISILASGCTVFLGIFLVKKIGVHGSGHEENEMVKEIESLNSSIQAALASTDGHYSGRQLDAVVRQLKEVQLSLENQKKTLKEVEAKLDTAQGVIEEKESYHQSLKSAKAEDEEKVALLIARFDDIAAESISLEQRLAVSMKSLDQMMNELQLSEEQVVLFQDIQNALTEGSSQLRELFIEYDGIKKRIDTLNQQLEDLEGEYTKLVEQQLGE